MTMSSAVSKVTLNGDGSQTSWPFSFKVWKETDLEVSITDAIGNVTVTTNWSVELALIGGTVTYPDTGSPLPTGHKITIRRAMDFLQEADLISGTRWDPEVVETALDIACAERQQLREELDRAIKVPVSGGDGDDIMQEILDARDQTLAAVDQALAAIGAAEQAAGLIGTLYGYGTILAGNNTIPTPWPYDTTAGNVAVYLSGVKQAKSNLTFTDANTITLSEAVTVDTPYEVLSLVTAADSVLTTIYNNTVVAKDAAVAAQGAAEAAQEVAEEALAGTIDVPLGAVILVTGSATPVGYVDGAGSLLLRASYPDFWSWIQASGNVEVDDATWLANNTANGVNGKYSPGDGSTTFRVPNLGGTFPRFQATGQTLDSGRAIGSFQEDDIKSHQHYTPTITRIGFDTTGGSQGYGQDSPSGDGPNVRTSYTGGAETRGKNIAYKACIKAYTSVDEASTLYMSSETVYALTGTTPNLDPRQGTIQTWTLTANSAPVDTLTNGQSVTLMIDEGSAYSITWPTMSWVGGSAPALETTGYTVVVLWKVGTTLYGALVGGVA